MIAGPVDKAERDSRSVFVKNVHYTADKKEIEEHFADCGSIKTISIMKDKFSGQSKG